jgi:plasmid maintenance system antidote protein VapI
MEQVTQLISIQVPSDVAAAYNQSSVEDQQQLSAEVAAILRRRFGQTHGDYASLQQMMDRLAVETQQNGLTEEILAKILQQDEDFGTAAKKIAGVELEARSLDPSKLKNALLDAIERQDPRYEVEVREALEEAVQSISAGDRRGMTMNEFGEWLTNL